MIWWLDSLMLGPTWVSIILLAAALGYAVLRQPRRECLLALLTGACLGALVGAATEFLGGLWDEGSSQYWGFPGDYDSDWLVWVLRGSAGAALAGAVVGAWVALIMSLMGARRRLRAEARGVTSDGRD